MECFKTTPDYNIFCYACKGQGAKCQHHENAHYEELYDHIDINVSHPDNLEDYIAWEMQKFDGGLQSFNKPELPATQLGTLAEVIQPVKDTTTPFSGTIERRQTVVQSISRKANITIAKLYLDDIHKQQSFDVIEKVGDRLPRNLVALFDAEIKCIKQQPRHQSDIALMAIVAAAEKNQGVPLVLLEDWMRDAISRLPHLASSPPRSLEDILRYANGFIAESYFEGRCISTYNELFAIYVREDYNETLFWARSQLNIHRVSRSLTYQPKLTSPPLVSSPPTIDHSFEAVSQKPGRSLQGSSFDYFDRWLSSNDLPISPKQITSPKEKSNSGNSEFESKMFRASSRSNTMKAPIRRKSGFTNSIVNIPEEMAPTERRESRSKRSVSKPSNRLCALCENTIFGSGELSGKYQRPYSHIKVHVAKRCLFCSTLYKKFLSLPMQDRERFSDHESPVFHWTFRSTAKSRESSNSIVVSFQSSLPETRQSAEKGQYGSASSSIDASNSILQHQRPIRRFHLIVEDDLGQVPEKDELGPTTDPASNAGKQISTWIHECDHDHANCLKVTKTTWVPTRLLDLHYGDLSSVRLVKTADEGVTGPYITLSHCWGPRTKENEFLTTQGETEKIYMTQGIKISALSTNFQQAISVAKFIGIRYIWIDSLCIIQGEHSDFKSEGQLMHKVYRNSYCNIAVADSEDSRGGVFRARNPADILPGKYEGDGSSAMFGTKTWRIVPEDLWEAGLLESSIYTRGWVFQGKWCEVGFSFNDECWEADNDRTNACPARPPLYTQADLLGLWHAVCMRSITKGSSPTSR
jgi:hypothetical protein